MIRTRLNIGILYLTLFVLLISSCETGHEIIEEDDCGTVLLGDLKLNDSLYKNWVFSRATDSATFFDSRSERIVFEQARYSHDFYEIDYCDSTYRREGFYTEYRPQRLAPTVKMGLSLSGYWRENGDSVVPVLHFTIGKFRSPVRVDTFRAMDDTVNFYSKLDIMNQTYYNCLHLRRRQFVENEINGLVYSTDQGLLGFYRNDSVYWRIK